MQQNAPYRALVLDMDGTMMDSLAPMEEALAATGANWNIPITEEILFIVRYQPSSQLEKALDIGTRYPDFKDEFLERFRQNEDKMSLFPGIRALLAADTPMGIVTSELSDELFYNLERLELPRERFASIVCFDTTPFEKPHPFPLRFCLEQMGAAPEEALYVGDSVFDMACARDAGVDFGLALWGAGSAEQFGAATHVFARPEDILPLLAQGGKEA